MVMVSNATGIEVGLLAGQYPGRIGHLFSPGGERGPWAEVPHALDNGAWPAFKNKRLWNERAWNDLIVWARGKAMLAGLPPLWALVPDVVGKRDETLAAWDRYESTVRDAGFRRGFAVQNGMTFADVPDSECMLFLGGDDDWKDAAIRPWCARFPGRVHVGRVSGMPRLVASYHAGAVSVDGTNWFRKGNGNSSQANNLRKFLRETSAQSARKEAA